MASEDASVTVCTKQALTKGHRYGPFKGRLRVVDIDDNVPFGTWKIYPNTEEDKTYNLSSLDASIPHWLHFIKLTRREEECNITLVQNGKKFFFEMTRDVLEGVEYALRGRRSETAVEETVEPVDKPPVTGRKRGRKPKALMTPEELQALEDKKKKELEDRVRRISTRDRSRRCIECGKIFISAVLFMRHRGKCGSIQEEDLLTDSSDGDENTDDEVDKDEANKDEANKGEAGKGEDQGETGENGETVTDAETAEAKEGAAENGDAAAENAGEPADGLAAGLQTAAVPDQATEAGQHQEAPVIPNPLLQEIDPTPQPPSLLAKRPRGRPRKDGQPPIQRKKRLRRKRRRKRRRRFDDEEDEEDADYNRRLPPNKQAKDECIPTAPDPEHFPFTCSTCQKVFPTQSWFDLHTEQHAQPGLTYLICNLCDAAFRYLSEHSWHAEEVHRLGRRDQVLSEKFRCDTCKKSFRSPIHLERHRRRAAAEEPLPKGPVQIKCKFCEKSFSMEVGLENHTEKHHPEYERYQCTENDCLVTFPSKEERAAHLAGEHLSDPRRIYKCPVDQCFKAYTSMAALNYHYELRHTGASRPFQCETCGKRWVKIGKLREHLKTHSTEKNELCDICGRAYKSRPELKDHHLEAHTEGGKIKLKCRFCPAQFSRRSSRSYHEKRHRNDFPYVCPKPGCKKRFIAVIDFKRHLIFHTGAKLYRCRFCSNCFTRSDYLKCHEKKHHLRGEKLIGGPSIEETVTIKVPWPMEKGVKVHGQNVVVIIEPDPALAEGRMTEEAVSALESLHDGEAIPTQMHLASDTSDQAIITTVSEVTSQSTDILQQAAAEAMQDEEQQEQPIQLLQFQTDSQPISYIQGNSATAAIQEAVFQAMSSQQQQQSGVEAAAATHQILLQTGDGAGTAAAFLQQAISGGGEAQIMQAASSEQAALMLQELAANGAQVVFQPSAEAMEAGSAGASASNTTTMQATLQNENGETSIVMVNLGPEMVTEVNEATAAGSTISIPVMEAQTADDDGTNPDRRTSTITIPIVTSEAMATAASDAMTHNLVMTSDPNQTLDMGDDTNGDTTPQQDVTAESPTIIHELEGESISEQVEPE